MEIPVVFIAIAIAALILLMLLIVFVAKYQTAKPDEALIISGSYLGSKNVHIDESNNKSKLCVEVAHSSCQFFNVRIGSVYYRVNWTSPPLKCIRNKAYR